MINGQITLQEIEKWRKISCWIEKIKTWSCRGAFFAGKEKGKSENIGENVKIRIRTEEALKCYGDSILRLAYSYFRNMYDAEEILQEVLLRYMQATIVFSDQRKEKAWLSKVAVNLCKNRLRYRRCESIDELEETLETENREDLSFVWKAMKSLPENQREVMHLFYYEGYTTGEISRILSRKESTVRSDLHRGRKRMKEILKEEYDFEV